MASFATAVIMLAPAEADVGGAQVAQQPESATPAQCQRMLEQGLAELQISYREFDQRNERGWRRLRFRGCNPEALMLIDHYLERNAATLRENERGNLNFHAAQVALANGQDGRAQFYLGRARLARDTSQDPLDWNSYVAATYAFVTRDWQSFSRHYQSLATRRVPRPDCTGGDQCLRADANLSPVERLRRCWGRPYRLAYYECRD